MRNPLRISEADISAGCITIMQLEGWRVVRTDPVSDRSRGKGFGEIGMADNLFLRYCAGGLAEALWIEWKREIQPGRATKATAHQQAWHRAERARGARTVIAGEDFPATIEGFVEWYRREYPNRVVR